MYKLAIYSDQSFDFSSWATWLERDFEVTSVTQKESLIAVLESWAPQVLLYSEKHLNPAHVSQLVSHRKNKSPLGLIIVAHQYDLRDELKSFESGADHYLLLKTPIESLRARLINVANRNSNSQFDTQPTLVHLPKNREVVRVDELNLVLTQGLIKINDEIRKATPTQYRLVEAFASQPNVPLTREWLRDNVFKNSSLSLRSIDAQVAKLKKSIPELRGYILNVYGNGYFLKPPKQKISA